MNALDARFPRLFDARLVAMAFAAFCLLMISAPRVEVDRFFALTAQAGAVALGAGGESQVLDGFGRLAGGLAPIQIETRTDVSRLETFDPDRLPPFARVETTERRVETLDPETFQTVVRVERAQVLIEPFGYVTIVAMKLLETLEMALWATLLAVLLSAPLCIWAARNYAPHPLLHAAARGVISFLRAMPELVTALFFVLAYGFGPIAGILALGFHSAGFLAKFYAEDIEAADRRPQEALQAIGVAPLVILRQAVWPQVAPQYVAYTLYVLDRNARMATVVGLVGAGGIGQELKGRFDLYEFGHVGTILVGVFLVVLALDALSSMIRSRMFGAQAAPVR